MKNRLCIFVLYDPDGIADDCVLYLLNAIKCHVNYLVVVCNGKMQDDSIVRLNSICEELIVRENEGFDSGAFKDTLINYLGWEKVTSFDELILMNDSCFGPIYPFDEVFSKMEDIADFWGITAQNEIALAEPNVFHEFERNVLPYHIQSYFFVICKRMLQSNDFRRFWETFIEPKTFMQAVILYELRFTEHFNLLGYSSAAYVDNSRYASDPGSNYVYIISDSFRLLSENKLPLIKRKAFFNDNKYKYLNNHFEVARKTLDYIANHTDYDADLIMKKLIRTCEPRELWESLHLDYVLSSGNSCRTLPQNRKTALIASIYYPDLVDYMFDNISNVPKEVDIIISAKGNFDDSVLVEKFKDLGRSNYKVVKSNNRGREWSGLLIACKDIFSQYAYIGFIKDKKSRGMLKYQTVGRSWMDMTIENTIKSSDFIYNVIACFEQNPRLGYLSTPVPYASHYFTAGALSWVGNFEATKDLADRLSLDCKLSSKNLPFVLGNSFWCRSDALRALFDYSWDYDLFSHEPMPDYGTISHALERIYPFVVQHEGYYSGLLFNEEYASLYLVNYQYMLTNFISDYHASTGLSLYSDDDISDIQQIKDFCRNYEKIYIYGAGYYGRHYLGLLDNGVIDIAGFVVSDGHRKCDHIMDKPVLELSELVPDSANGIVIAVSGSPQKEVLYELDKRGFTEAYNAVAK